MSAVPSIGRPRTTAETADFFDVDPSTIKRWVKAGLLTCIKGEGARGSVRFRDEDIAARLDQMAANGPAPPAPRPARNPKYAARTAPTRHAA